MEVEGESNGSKKAADAPSRRKRGGQDRRSHGRQGQTKRTRRENDDKGDGGSRKRVNALGEDLDVETVDVLTLDVEDLYHLTTVLPYRRRRVLLERCEEGGVIERTLWPLCIEAAQSRHGNEARGNAMEVDRDRAKGEEGEDDDDDGEADEDDDSMFTGEAAYVLALLVNCRSGSGGSAGAVAANRSNRATENEGASSGGGVSSPLSFVLQGADGAIQRQAFQLLIHSVVSHVVVAAKNDDVDAYRMETELVQFFITAYESLDLRVEAQEQRQQHLSASGNILVLSEAMLQFTDIGPLWKDMSPRKRDLELRKNASYRRRWGASQKKVLSESSSYLTRLIRRFLQTVERRDSIFQRGDASQVDEADEVDDEDDDDEEEEGDEKGDSSAVAGKPPGQSSLQSQELQHGRFLRRATLDFINRVLELLIDLVSVPRTRRYLRPYLSSLNFIVRCQLSIVYKRSNQRADGDSDTAFKLFRQLVTMLTDVTEGFGVVDGGGNLTGESGGGPSLAEVGDDSTTTVMHNRAHILQKLCHRHYADLTSDIIYAGVGTVCTAAFLRRVLATLDDATLCDIARRLRLVDEDDDFVLAEKENKARNRQYVMSVLIHHHVERPSEVRTLSTLPLYPDEKLLWDPHRVPPGHVGIHSSPVLALPKLNVRFLTYADYLLRCFKLLRLESAYGIRGDIVDAVKRMRPAAVQTYDDALLSSVHATAGGWGTTQFQGWARMALELAHPLSLKSVSPPKLGETIPHQIIAEVTIDLRHCGESLRREWDELSEFDNLFLIAVDATQMTGGPAPLMSTKVARSAEKPDATERRVPDEEDVTFPRRFGILAVRGCMILEVRDDNGNILNDPAESWQSRDAAAVEEDGDDKQKKKGRGSKRFLKVALDPAQYALDASDRGSKLGTDVYQALNVVVRRRGRENNFKAVLETVRGLMKGTGSINRVLPSWLHSVFLGYGDPSSAAHWSRTMKSFAQRTVGVTPSDAALDYGDTFLDEEHLSESFPDYEVTVRSPPKRPDEEEPKRQKYRVSVSSDVTSTLKISNAADAPKPKVEATPYPFPKSTKGNPVRFTPVQVSAIRSGLSPGLTLIVGPPGTGKTDVAVQTIASLYHSYPSQRTVIVTHSNAALNDLFEKVMARGDIDERYLLRLGSGERDLQVSSSHDFTKTGRVGYILSRRATLLEEVQLLSESLGVSGKEERGADGSASYSCETAEYFNFHHVKKRMQLFENKVTAFKTKHPDKFENVDILSADVASIFPFSKFFGLSTSDVVTLGDARKYYKKLEKIFQELAEYRPLELLRSQRQRTDYLLTKQARIVAMTCTHAAIVRSHMIELGFQYDNLVMEEAGQMMDVETFVPLLLQKGESDESPTSTSRLKRICLIGDHHQLPPVVKNRSFSKFSNLDQSLFARLIRLGVPAIQLNRQGRARAEIARLYSWRYRDLGDLEHVQTLPEFRMANPGFAYTFQMINVDDFEGRGESTPTAYFYQNVGEAEYVVALFQYMVMVGYPPAKIAVLTTYNGQKDLILDIISQRCGPGTPLAGVRPGAVSTVDQFQGQQSDYVLLSLVRTRFVGHLRDVRRLVVALSRARLGLYVFCRQALFCSCHELRPALDQFTSHSRPTKLHLVKGEYFSSERAVDTVIPKEKLYEVSDVLALGGIVHSMQEEMITTNTTEEHVGM